MHKRILISGFLVAIVLIIVVVMLTGALAYPFGLDQTETADSNISSGPQNDGSSVILEEQDPRMLSGRLTITLRATPEEAQAWIEAGKSTQLVSIEYLESLIAATDDEDEKARLTELLEYEKNRNLDDLFLFTPTPDGLMDLVMPMGNMQATVDGETVTTDANGYYSFETILRGPHNLVLSYQGHDIREYQIEVDDSDHAGLLPIESTQIITFADFSKNMG